MESKPTWQTGLDLLHSGKIQEARSVLQQASLLDPDSFECHFYLGIAAAESGHDAEAENCFRKAIALDRDHAPVYYNLALLLEREHRADEALASYREALRLSPDYTAARQRLDKLSAPAPARAPAPVDLEIAPRQKGAAPKVAADHPAATQGQDAAVAGPSRVECKLCGMTTVVGPVCEWCHKPLRVVEPLTGPRHATPAQDAISSMSAPGLAAQRVTQPSGDPTSTAGLPIVRGQVLPAVTASGGFMDSIDRGWTFITNAYALAFEQKQLLLPILLGGLVGFLFSAVMVGIGFGVWWSSGHPIGEIGGDLQAWFSRHRALLALLSAALLLGNLMITFFFKGMTVSMVDAYLKGRDPSLRVAWRDALKNMGALALLAIVGTLIEMLIASARRQSRGSLGLDALLIGGAASMVETTWTVVSFLLLPIIIVEDAGFGQAIGRVRDIHRKNLMQIGVGEVGIRLVAWIAGSLFGLLVVGLSYVLVPLKLPGILTLVAIFLIGVLTINVLNSFAKACYYTCLYLWAAEVEGAPDPSQALIPAPLAAAFI